MDSSDIEPRDAVLNELRGDAAQALRETVGLAVTGATAKQVLLAAKFAVTAQARYTIELVRGAGW